MSSETWVVIATVVLVVLIVSVVAWFASRRSRRNALKDHYGPEYERVARRRGSHAKADRELQERAQRHSDLDIRPLQPAARDRYEQEWNQTQSRFVDDPPGALVRADDLVKQVMDERGYPVNGDFEQRSADLSVEHADVLDHYRRAHQISGRAGSGEASTEEQRRAMKHYRAMFETLLVTNAGA